MFIDLKTSKNFVFFFMYRICNCRKKGHSFKHESRHSKDHISKRKVVENLNILVIRIKLYDDIEN